MKRPSLPSLLPLLPALAAVLLYFLIFFRFSVDIPFGDDYAVLSYVLNATNPSVPAKLPLLFSLHNEHRIVTLRLAALASYAILHRLDFVLIALLGNLGLLGLAWLLTQGPHPRGLPPPDLPPKWMGAAAWMPVACLLFQPQHREILNWAMCAFTNVYVILLSFLSLYFLARAKSGLSFAAAISLAVLAAFTNGNGIFVVFVGAIVLLLGRQFRRLGVWLSCGTITLGLYFWGYVKNPAHPDILPFLAASPLKAANYFFAVLGSFADFGQKSHAVPIGAGLLLFLAALLALWKLRDRHVLLFSWIAFLLLSFGANALTRAPMGLEMAFMSRYKLLSILLVVLLYLSALALARRKRTTALAGSMFAVLFCAFSFVLNYHFVRDNKVVLSMNLIEWNARKADLPYPNQQQAESILRLASVRHIYRPPAGLNIRRSTFPFGGIDGGQDAVIAGQDEIQVTGWALDDGGRPSIIVRRERAPGDPPTAFRSDGRIYVGKASFRNGSIPGGQREFYGFLGLDRMIWEFRAGAEQLGPRGKAGAIRLSFLARDDIGQETLLGTRVVLFPPQESSALPELRLD